MDESQIQLLKRRVATLESELENVRNENKRLKQINRRLQGKQNRRGRPSKDVNFLDLYATVPNVMNLNFSAPRLVKEERAKLKEYLGNNRDGSLVNAIYKHREKIVRHGTTPAMSPDELMEALKDLL